MFWFRKGLRNSISLVICLLLVTAAGLPAAERQAMQLTLYSMDFYGYIEGMQAGDEIIVLDGQGVLCGRYAVDKEGRYGFLHVYGDDKSTVVDEGADRNEALAFYLNGSPLTPISLPTVLWLGDGQQQRVDFARR